MVWSFVQATVLSVPGSLLNLHRGLAAGPTLGLADLVLEATCFRFGSFLSAVCRCLPCPKGAGCSIPGRRIPTIHLRAGSDRIPHLALWSRRFFLAVKFAAHSPRPC